MKLSPGHKVRVLGSYLYLKTWSQGNVICYAYHSQFYFCQQAGVSKSSNHGECEDV